VKDPAHLYSGFSRGLREIIFALEYCFNSVMSACSGYVFSITFYARRLYLRFFSNRAYSYVMVTLLLTERFPQQTTREAVDDNEIQIAAFPLP